MSLLFLLLEVIAPTSRIVIAPKLIASTTMAIMSSIKVVPRSVLRFMRSSRIVMTLSRSDALLYIFDQLLPVCFHFWIRPAGLIVTASQARVTPF